MSNRKLVMEEHGGKVLVGMQQEGCDPIVKTVEGDLYDALGQVNGLLAEAQEQWAATPKNPAYKPPATPKKAAAPAATAQAEPQKAEELPLLSGQEKPEAEEAAPAPAPSTEAPTEAEPVAAEETPEETKEEVAEPQAAPAEPEPEPEGPPAEPEPSPEPAEEKAEAAPEPQPSPAGEVGYYLKDGRGPYADIQAAMDEMGVDKENRPHHNRWDRLSTTLKEQIIRRPKA